MIVVQNKQTSEDGTVKFLFRFPDGVQIECVRMRHPYGMSICVSSQAGCNMGCAFCASGLKKKLRDLTAEEMLEQVLAANTEDAPVTHVVVMGTGEPFENTEEVLRFCDLVTDQRKLDEMAEGGLNALAPRHITVSTCGLIPGIRTFARTEKRYNLAISLHAANNALRSRLMPVNKKYPLEELLSAASDYCLQTGRRVAFEYLLLRGVNDSAEDAAELAALLRSYECRDSFYVNLIPFNAVSELDFQGADKESALAFYDAVMKGGIKATLRKERGTDIAAACGQLRLSYLK